MSSSYENIPQRIGNAERETAVERLRVNLDQGRLDQPTYETRVATALAATTQDDLEPLFHDLPPVVSSSTYELYPHQSVAMPTPSPYQSDPVPGDVYSGEVSPGRAWWGTIPPWLIAIVVIAVITGLSFATHGFWFIWMFFVFPAFFRRMGRNNQSRNGRNRQRPY